MSCDGLAISHGLYIGDELYTNIRSTETMMLGVQSVNERLLSRYRELARMRGMLSGHTIPFRFRLAHSWNFRCRAGGTFPIPQTTDSINEAKPHVKCLSALRGIYLEDTETRPVISGLYNIAEYLHIGSEYRRLRGKIRLRIRRLYFRN